MFLLNSRMGHFTAPPSRVDPFSLGYGAGLPSSLTRFLSRALVYWYHSTCVGFGTVAGLITRGFSRQYGITHSWQGDPARSHSGIGHDAADLPAARPAPLDEPSIRSLR